MNDNDKDRSVDDLLDALLRRYRSEEPRAGLENRILAGVAVLAVLVVSLRFTSRPVQPTVVISPAPQAVAPKAETPKMVAVTPSASWVTRKPSRRPQTTAAAFHRPGQFPTPSPLSEQEKLLFAYVASAPGPELSTSGNRDPKIEPLQFPEINIARIEIKELPRINE